MIPLLLALGCQGPDATSTPGTGTPPPTTGATSTLVPSGMEAYGLLNWTGSELIYAEGVQPYELATPLFSDFALKQRAIWLPEGTAMDYRADDHVLDLPVDTVILKSFLFPADLRAPTEDLRLIETRVLQLTDEGWQAEPWVWEDDQTARLAPSGLALPIDFVDADGTPQTAQYLVPQKNQCIDCHELVLGEDRVITPIGPKARHLNVAVEADGGEVNQLEHLAGLGLIQGLPALAEVPVATDARTLEGVDPYTLDAATLDAATRDYLDINCAHCHNPNGTEGISSQLFLDRGTTEPFDLGVCKLPGSAGLGNGGLTWDIVPGDHTQSILWFRVDTEQVGAMMPDIGRSLRHPLGSELIAAWIDAMEPVDCSN